MKKSQPVVTEGSPVQMPATLGERCKKWG